VLIIKHLWTKIYLLECYQKTVLKVTTIYKTLSKKLNNYKSHSNSEAKFCSSLIKNEMFNELTQTRFWKLCKLLWFDLLRLQGFHLMWGNRYNRHSQSLCPSALSKHLKCNRSIKFIRFKDLIFIPVRSFVEPTSDVKRLYYNIKGKRISTRVISHLLNSN